MDDKLVLPGRYYRTLPINRPGVEEETLELKAEETTFVGMHCWNIGCPDGPSINLNYCVGMGFPANFREGYRIVKKYIYPAMEASRKAGVMVSHVENDKIGRKHPETQKYLIPPQKQAGGKPILPAVPGYAKSFLKRAHGKDYATNPESPYHRMDRIKIVMPEANEPFVYETDQFDRILRRRGIKNIIYSGFAADMCILFSPGGTQAMFNRGYRVYLIREATLGVEYPDTFKKRLCTQWGIRYFEVHLGDTIGYDNFIKACNRIRR